MRRLIPEPVADTNVDELIAELRPVEEPPPDRPLLVTNFVLSLDGEATLKGRSGPLGSETDTKLLVGLRTRVDALMIGAGTMRVERYGRVIGDAAKRERREREGLPHDPLMVIVTNSMELPWDAPLFTAGWGRILIFTASDRERPQTATSVRVVRHERRVDLVEAMRHLRVERGVRSLLCEGGPHLHAELIAADLVDELFVTHVPKLAGGDGLGLVAGLAERERPLDLVSLSLDEGTGELFARYRFRR